MIMDEPVLAEEYSYFAEIKSELLKDQGGKFALIKGKKLVGVFDTDTDAYQVGVMQFGNEAFLIVRITQEEESYWIPTLELGLLDADIK